MFTSFNNTYIPSRNTDLNSFHLPASLMRALMSPDMVTPSTEVEGITDGIDISNWSINKAHCSVTYSVWDFAGQTVYYNTHQV